MIAPLQESTPSSNGGVSIHLHLPDSLKDALMLLISSVVARPNSLFAEVDQSRMYPQFRASTSTTPAESHQRTTGAAAATRLQEQDAVRSQPADPATFPPESLLDCYRRVLRAKRLRSASPGTVGDHESSMKAFDRWFQAQQEQETQENSHGERLHRLSTPVQSLSDPNAVLSFVRDLIDSGRSPILINRRLTHLAMVAKALKIDFEKPSPDEVKRLSHALAQPQKTGSEKRSTESNASSSRRIPSFAEIDAMATNVTHLRYPYGEHAPYFWRGWIRFLAFIGPRSRDVVSTVARKTGLCKSDVIFETLCPIADVSNALGYELHSPHGWMHYTIGKDHHSDCRRILFPMPKWMRDWVRFYWELSGDSERLFPSCQPGSRCLSQGPMSDAWNSIIAAASVDSRLVPSEGKGDKIALRKYAANWWQLATLKLKGDASLAEKMAHYVLHHAEVTTANKHYLNVQAAVLPTMLELIPTWQIPAGSAPPVSLLPE